MAGPWGLWNHPWEIQARPGQPDLGEDTWRPCTCPPFTISANLLSGPHLQTRKQIQEGLPSRLRVSRAEAGERQALRQRALEPFPGPGPGQCVLGRLRPWRGPGGAPRQTWRPAWTPGSGAAVPPTPASEHAQACLPPIRAHGDPDRHIPPVPQMSVWGQGGGRGGSLPGGQRGGVESTSGPPRSPHFSPAHQGPLHWEVRSDRPPGDLASVTLPLGWGVAGASRSSTKCPWVKAPWPQPPHEGQGCPSGLRSREGPACGGLGHGASL